MPEKRPGDYAEIWKFPLEVQTRLLDVHWKDGYEVKMPGPATILSVQEQHGVPTIWAKVFPGCEEEVHHFRLVATGRECPIGDTFVGTVQLDNGSIILHVFEVAHA